MAGAGFQNKQVYSENPDFSGVNPPSPDYSIKGNNQVWLGRDTIISGQSQIDVMILTQGQNITMARLGEGDPGNPGTLTFSAHAGTGIIGSIGMQSGVDPVVPDSNGLIEFVGQTALAGTTPVQTEGLAANIMAVNVQISQALAATDVTKIGLSNFDSDNFAVDANGFVTLTNPPPTPASITELFDDFIYIDLDDADAMSFPFYLWFQGAAGEWTNTNVANHPGILQLSKTSATGNSLTSSGSTAGVGIVCGYYKITYEWLMKIDVLSAANPTYVLAMGLTASQSEHPVLIATQGIYFYYTHTANSGKWQIITINGGGNTTSNTNSTVDTEWHRYKIVVNSAGTSIAFYIDGVEVTNSPITTNITTSTLMNIFAVDSTSGTNLKTFKLDYWYAKFEYTR